MKHRPHSPPPLAQEPHESALAQVQGNAAYIDDLPLTEGTLHAVAVLSPVAHGVVQHIDWD